MPPPPARTLWRQESTPVSRRWPAAGPFGEPFDRLAPLTSRGDVIDGAWELDAQWAAH